MVIQESVLELFAAALVGGAEILVALGEEVFGKLASLDGSEAVAFSF